MGHAIIAVERNRVEAQRAEFDAFDELKKKYDALCMTPVVDDDYPEVRHEYEGALAKFIERMKANGRFDGTNRYRLKKSDAPDGDAAIAIGEDAFRAGYKSAADRARAFHPTKIEDDAAHMQSAWSDYEPPEDIKALVE